MTAELGEYDHASDEIRRRIIQSQNDKHDDYGQALYHQLFDKGYLLLPADHLAIEGTPALLSIDPLDIATAKYRDNVSVEDIDIAVEAELRNTLKYRQNTKIREEEATLWTVYWLDKYAGSQFVRNAPRHEDGRAQVSIIFGLAHRNSLMALFKNMGIGMEARHVNRQGFFIDDMADISALFGMSEDEVADQIRKNILDNN